MENNKNKKSVKFQGDMLNFCDFIQVFVFTPNHHLNYVVIVPVLMISVDDFAAAHLVCSPAFFSQGPIFTGIERGISLTQEIYAVISQIGFCSVRVAVACAIFKRTSDLS